MSSAVLQISDIVHRFGERVAVDHLTVGIGEREIVGLVGRNGAGKTTTMRAVMGIVRPSGGEVRWEGHPVRQADRLRFGYMPEERGLYPQMPVLDQLVYFARLHGRDKVTAREQARHWVERLGLGPRQHDRVVALSHGNQQRVQLAVALVSDPELLVLDEPFAGLDPAAVDTLTGILRDRAVAEVKQSLAPAVQALLQETVDVAHERQVLTQAGVPPATIGPAMRPVPFATSAIQPPPAVSPARRVAALASAILMFVTLGIYGTAIANGVAQEKTTRTAEVLLAMVRPRQLLFGKVTGIGTCALVQVGIAVGAGLIANAFTRDTSISSTTWALLPAVLLWFLLGFALYSFAYAAAGAIVARQEEVQFVVVPMALLNVGSYLLLFAMMASPHAPWVRVLSFLPPFAPAFMSARIALGVVSPWEVLAAALVMLVAIYGAARLVGRIYAAALVHGGARLSWGAALRLREI